MVWSDARQIDTRVANGAPLVAEAGERARVCTQPEPAARGVVPVRRGRVRVHGHKPNPGRGGLRPRARQTKILCGRVTRFHYGGGTGRRALCAHHAPPSTAVQALAATGSAEFIAASL